MIFEEQNNVFQSYLVSRSTLERSRPQMILVTLFQFSRSLQQHWPWHCMLTRVKAILKSKMWWLLFIFDTKVYRRNYQHPIHFGDLWPHFQGHHQHICIWPFHSDIWRTKYHILVIFGIKVYFSNAWTPDDFGDLIPMFKVNTVKFVLDLAITCVCNNCWNMQIISFIFDTKVCSYFILQISLKKWFKSNLSVVTLKIGSRSRQTNLT